MPPEYPEPPARRSGFCESPGWRVPKTRKKPRRLATGAEWCVVVPRFQEFRLELVEYSPLTTSVVSRHGIMLLGLRLGLGDGLIAAERHAVDAAVRPCPMGKQVEAAPADDVGASAIRRPVGHGTAVSVIVPRAVGGS